jgi:hypothetical protein
MITPLVALLIVFAFTSTANAAHVFSGLDVKTGEVTSLLRDDPTKQGTVVIFMSAKCPCSISHAEEIIALSRDYPDFRFIAVNSNADEKLEDVKRYFQSFPFPVLKDLKSMIAIELKALKTPHAFIFNSEGKRLFHGGVSSSATFARADRKHLREALEDLKEKREIRTPVARALGCAIDRGTP